MKIAGPLIENDLQKGGGVFGRNKFPTSRMKKAGFHYFSRLIFSRKSVISTTSVWPRPGILTIHLAWDINRSPCRTCVGICS